jgi:hypothetical protein
MFSGLNCLKKKVEFLRGLEAFKKRYFCVACEKILCCLDENGGECLVVSFGSGLCLNILAHGGYHSQTS